MTADISVQLYTVRDSMAADPRATLERLAAIGYRAVEPYNLVETAATLAPALAALGLHAPSAHARVLVDELEPLLELAAGLGVSTLINSSSDRGLWSDRAGIEQVAERMNAAADVASRAGIQIGYHNHAWEAGAEVDGRSGLEFFAERLDDSVVLEVDTFWAAVAGQDVPALLERLGNRVRYLHVKDGVALSEHAAQVAVGDGVMPIASILEAAPQACPVVELDQFDGDVLHALDDSFAWLSARGAS